MERLMQQLLLLLLLWLPQMMSFTRETTESNEVVYHFINPEPDRHRYIWNPFPGFCGPNATSVRCGGVCPETCAYKSHICVPYCGVPCVCRSGYVFREPLLKCILRSDCPANVQQQAVKTHRVFQ